MGVLEILYLYCASLMPNTEAVAECMVEIHECTFEERKGNPDAPFGELAAVCAARREGGQGSGGVE